MPARNRILIYLRKSNMLGDDNNLIAHTERMLRHAVKLGGVFNLETDVYEEPEGHRSATSEKQRPAYRAMMKRVSDPKSDVGWILGNDRARLWRDKDEYGMWLKHIKRLKVEFIPVTETPVQDISTAVGMAQEGMMGIMNAFYSQYISEKRRGQFEALRERTKYVATKAPMGTRSEGKGMERRITLSDETYETQGGERKLVDTVVAFFQMYVDNDWGVRQCALELNARGYLWKHGKKLGVIRWQTLRKILNLVELYYEIKAIDKTLYHRVLRRMEQRKSPSSANRVGREPLMLARLVYCAECKTLMTAENRGEYYNSIYRHQHNACRWGAAVSARIVDDLFRKEMERFGEYSQQDLNQLFVHLRGQQDNTIDYAAKRERTLLMLENLETAYLAGDLGDLPTARPHYLARKTKLKAELEEIPVVVESPIDEQFTIDSLGQFMEWMGQVEESLPHRMNGLIREFTERVEFNMKTKKMEIFFVWDT